MDPFVLFLKEGVLPNEKGEAEKIRRKAPQFWLSEEQKLYKHSFSGPYLLCVHLEAVEPLLEELHEGICGNHTGGISLSQSPYSRVLVAMYADRSTIFGIPHTLISDSELQFNSRAFRRYCCEMGIRNRYLTPAYPQGNGQDEAVNKVIVNGLKKRLDETKGRWVEELPHVLWTYRTTLCRSNGETPFSMTFGSKTVIPLELGFPTLRTSLFTLDSNDQLLEKSLDLVDERREAAMVQLAYYHQMLKQGYDTSVRARPLALGDLVLRKVVGTAKNSSWGKLGPN
nr:uncharacterized protein LOC112034250 [Quercus suber]